MESGIEFYSRSAVSSSRDDAELRRLPNATDAKHFSCAYCNTREAYTPSTYTQHMSGRNHRAAMLLHEARMSPGGGRRPFVLMGDETHVDFQSGVLREAMLDECKPFWFVKKNDPSAVCLLCFELTPDCEHVLVHQHRRHHRANVDAVEWPMGRRPPRIYYCVPCERQIVYNDDVPNAEQVWRTHVRGSAHANGLIAYSRVNKRVKLNERDTRLRARQDEELLAREEWEEAERVKMHRRMLVENEVLADLDSDDGMHTDDRVEVSVSHVPRADRAARIPRPEPIDVAEHRLANPVQQLNMLLDSNTGQSVMSKLLSSMPSTSSAPRVFDFAVIPPDETYPPYVWHGLPDTSRHSINWVRSTRPAQTTVAYYRQMEAENVAKHRRRIEERVAARDFVTPTAITKYVGRLHIVASLPGAVAVLIDALPQATKREVKHMFKELTPTAVSLVGDNEEGAALLGDLLTNAATTSEDRGHLVRSFVHDLTPERLCVFLASEPRVHLLHTMHRLHLADANRSLVGKLIDALRLQPIDAFPIASHAKAVHLFEDVFRALAMETRDYVHARLLPLVEPSTLVPSMLASPMCRVAVYTLAGCLANGMQRARLGRHFAESVRQGDALLQLATVDSKTFIRLFNLADDDDRALVVHAAILMPLSRPSIYAVLMRHPHGRFVARRLFEKADAESKRAIGLLVERNFHEYQHCEYAGTLARIIRRHASTF